MLPTSLFNDKDCFQKGFRTSFFFKKKKKKEISTECEWNEHNYIKLSSVTSHQKEVSYFLCRNLCRKRVGHDLATKQQFPL